VLKGYGGNNSGGYPAFMQSSNWENKRLLTYVSSVTDWRHLSYLVAKSGMRETIKETEMESEMPGYAEPDINLYSRLEYMGMYWRAFLYRNDFKNQGIYAALDGFIDTACFLKEVSRKELLNKPLTEEEEKRIRNFASELKALTLSAVESKGSTKQWEFIPEEDRYMAVVSDAFYSGSNVLQTAVGLPDYIYVVVPYEGKLYLARGSTYSYYEFIQPLSKKLKDKDWQDIMKDGRELGRQTWIKSK
jgi:hypothetical protein